jgi:hypothetical protein
VGDEKVLAAIEQVELDAIAGFQYAQRELRVKAGSKISLSFPNLDPSMPHNVVIVQPDRLTTIMDASMKLSASPEGLAKHYVPEDKGGIVLSPVLQSGKLKETDIEWIASLSSKQAGFGFVGTLSLILRGLFFESYFV